MQQKTVFISYRRTLSKHLARSIYMDLRSNEWNVFLDVNTIDSGDFDRIILNQIGARAHFILLISEGALERCATAGDWVLREIEEAVRLNRNIVPIIEEEANFTQELAYLPENLREILAKKNALPLPHFFFDPAMDMLRTRFLKTPEYVQIQATPIAAQVEVERRLEQVETPTKPNSLSIMPAPFDWITIPTGKVTLLDDYFDDDKSYLKKNTPTTFDVAEFQIAKYPVTNAQYRLFIEAGGYETQKWWTEAGWQQKQQGNWVDPLHWDDSDFNGDAQAVVGVSWYESVAFCRWLSDITGENIILPSEQEWQRAAQGDDDRLYPWGDEWDSSKCQNSDNSMERTSPVTQFEGKGDSPFAVVDMAGNVWERCRTDFKKGAQDINDVEVCVIRGGSWWFIDTEFFRCVNRSEDMLDHRCSDWGFRLARFNE